MNTAKNLHMVATTKRTISAIVLIFGILNIGTVQAQTKKQAKKKQSTETTSSASNGNNKKSYLDSLVEARYLNPNNSQDGKKTETHRKRGSGKIVNPTFTEKKKLPAQLWYGRDFSDRMVKLWNHNMDSIPDEVKLVLVRDTIEFCFPIKNVKTSPYGWRERWNRPHRGVDIALNVGDPIRCAFDGVVRIAHYWGGYGNLIVVRHYNGLETVYGHLSKINVKPYQEVKAGDIIGLGGSTGHSTGPHLHFEVRFLFEAFDPEWIIDFKTYTLRTKRLYLDKTYFGITKPRNKQQKMSYKADISIVKETDYPERERKPIKEKKYYLTKKGDTWEKVAKKNGVSQSQLQHWNPDIKGKLKPNTEIRVQ